MSFLMLKIPLPTARIGVGWAGGGDLTDTDDVPVLGVEAHPAHRVGGARSDGAAGGDHLNHPLPPPLPTIPTLPFSQKK